MNLYPIYLKLKDKKCLVVGGGKVAQRKIEGLKECEADITVVSPALTPELSDAVKRGEIRYICRGFFESDVEGMALVIAATDDSELNSIIARRCNELGILVNVVDDPEMSTFFVPALIRRGQLCISISTGGKSPLLAKRIKEHLESQIGSEFEEFVSLIGDLRKQIQAEIPDQAQRQILWENILTPDFVSLIKTMNKETLKNKLKR